MMRRGLTVLETLIMFAIMAIVMTSIWRLFHTGVNTSKRVMGALDAQATLRAKFQALVQDLQGAHSLFYPSPGGKSQPGLGYVDRRGRSIMIFTDKEGDEVLLYRTDLNAKTKKVLARGVESFRATIPPVEAGEKPRTVNLSFGLFAQGTENEEGEKLPVKIVTSVTLRALKQRFPD